MDLGLKGRVAIVAAASTGLGRAVARELSKEGAKVAICARTAQALAKTAEDAEKRLGEIYYDYFDDRKAASGWIVTFKLDSIGSDGAREDVGERVCEVRNYGEQRLPGVYGDGPAKRTFRGCGGAEQSKRRGGCRRMEETDSSGEIGNAGGVCGGGGVSGVGASGLCEWDIDCD